MRKLGKIASGQRGRNGADRHQIRRGDVRVGSKTEIVPRNSDFRSSLNSRHSPTGRSRPKNAKPGHRIALFDWVQAYHSDDFGRCNAGIRFVNSRLTFKTLTRKSRTASKKAPYAFGHGGNAVGGLTTLA
jgi:hypothetical protein